jgi:hypothetical protein
MDAIRAISKRGSPDAYIAPKVPKPDFRSHPSTSRELLDDRSCIGAIHVGPQVDKPGSQNRDLDGKCGQGVGLVAANRDIHSAGHHASANAKVDVSLKAKCIETRWCMNAARQRAHQRI